MHSQFKKNHVHVLIRSGILFLFLFGFHGVGRAINCNLILDETGSEHPSGVLPYDAQKTRDELNANPNHDALTNYGIIEAQQLTVTPENYIEKYQPQVGFSNIQRDANGNAVQAKFRVLMDNDNAVVTVLSDLNGWGLNVDPKRDQLHQADGRYYEGTIPVKHGMEYRLLVSYNGKPGQQLLDPAATTFTTQEYLDKVKGPGQIPYENSIFWDHDRADGYKMTTTSTDLRGKYIALGEADIFSLVAKWKGGPPRTADTYKYIAESGIIDKIKSMGYNAIEFLPFNSSVDGNNWIYRYQVFGLYGPNSRFGTPDEFKQMVDAFNKHGIGIISDVVLGHYPIKGQVGNAALSQVGPQNFKKDDGSSVFGDVLSPWGTYRYDYNNPWVRKFLIDAMMTNMQRYGISGIRFDNIDGIKDYPGGGGWQFLQELVSEVRKHRPETWMNDEMFFGNNKVTEAMSKGGLGTDSENNANAFDFVKDNLLKRTEEIDMERLRQAIRNPWGWGETMRLGYLTDHDEAANGRGGATGAYPATLIKAGNDFAFQYAEKKTKAFGSLMMLIGPASMDMMQARLLQEGSFSDNSAVDWSLEQYDSQRRTAEYFSKLTWALRDEPAFGPQNMHPDIENHTDYDNKVISLKRIDFKTGKTFYALINLGDHDMPNYKFGVEGSGKFKVSVDSDLTQFGGTNQLANALQGGDVSVNNGDGAHGKPNSLTVPHLAPYQVILLESD